MNYQQIVDDFSPYKAVVEWAAATAWRDVLVLVRALGRVRPGEVGTFIHAAMRNRFRNLADELDPFLILKEERDGLGLDYVLLDIGAKNPLALCWHKPTREEDKVSRNNTIRTGNIVGQGTLFDDDDNESMPILTVFTAIADHYYEGGNYCGWLKRVQLVKEHPNRAADFLDRIATYTKPESPVVSAPSPRVGLSTELEELRRLAKELRKKLG